MPTYEGSHAEEIAAPRERVWGLLTDYERIPDWQDPVERVTVVERDAAGRGEVVEYEIATPVRNVSYRLRHGYQEPRSVSGDLVEGQVKEFRGEWTLRQTGEATTEAEFTLRIDPGRWVPGKVARMLHDKVMKRAVTDLKKAAEAPVAAPVH